MTSNNQIISNPQIDATDETTKFALGVAMTGAALIGIWGTICLVSAMVSMGPLNVIQGYVTAVIG